MHARDRVDRAVEPTEPGEPTETGERTDPYEPAEPAGTGDAVGVQVMAVINATPDSFSDGGDHASPDAAVARAELAIAQGASWLDVGGESTRPGATPVEPAEELRRVLPVLERVVPLASAAGVRVSVDTRNAATARAAVAAGVELLNDVSASLWPLAAELGVGWVAMHMAGEPATMQRSPAYDDVVDDVRRFLADRAARAVAAGVAQVWVDPGIGFGKTTEHNLALLASLDRLVADGHPVLVGTSRKRFTAELQAGSDAAVARRPGGAAAPEELPGPRDRLDVSLATATWAMVQGAQMVRVHDVGPTVEAATVVAGGFPAR